MRFKAVTFSIARTIPMDSITHDPDDRYANIKPFASCTVEFDEDDNAQVTSGSKHNMEHVKQVVSEAFDHAAGLAFEEIVSFKNELTKLYNEK